MTTTFRVLEVKTERLPSSDLLLAYSDDLPGLTVHGYSESEIETRVPDAIKCLLVARGVVVKSVRKLSHANDSAAARVRRFEAAVAI